MEGSTTVNDMVYRAMRSMIISGELAPGTRLVQRQLAKQFGTSNIPVVESIRRLERDGLVMTEPKWGARVRVWSMEDIEAIYLIREGLDGMAARMFAERATKAEWLTLTEYGQRFNDYARDSEQQKCDEADLALHNYIVKCGRSDFFYRFAENSCIIVATVTHAYVEPMKPEMCATNIGVHDSLIDAMGSGDPDTAERAAREHVRNALAQLKKNVRLEYAEGAEGVLRFRGGSARRKAREAAIGFT